jgi:hypothetical protein
LDLFFINESAFIRRTLCPGSKDDQGNIDIYDVSMSIDYADYADVTLNGINSGKLTFEGNLVSKEMSVIFKGQTR